jgi:Flp pilus assembly CpaE family ATPase
MEAIMHTVEFISKLEASGMPVEQAKVVAERFEDDSLVTTKVLEAALDKQFIKIGGLIASFFLANGIFTKFM